MFRIVLVVLAVIGLSTVLGGAGTAGLAGIGVLGVMALLAVKVLFFMMLFAFIGKMFWHGGRDPGYRRSPGFGRPSGFRSRPRREPAEPEPAPEDRFDEWHRMAHAKEEVDSWVSDLPDDLAE